MKKAPSITRYQDPRDFLADFYAYKKKADSKFSVRQFARKTGTSETYFHLVLSKKRVLTPDLAKKYVKGLGFKNHAEKTHFLLLAELGRPVKIGHGKVDFDRSFPHLILQLTQGKDFKMDPTWISKKIHGLLTPTQVKKELAWLTQSKQLALKKGKWTANNNFEIQSAHENMAMPRHKMTPVYLKQLQDFAHMTEHAPRRAQGLNTLVFSSPKAARDFYEEINVLIQKHTIEKQDNIGEPYGVLFSVAQFTND